MICRLDLEHTIGLKEKETAKPLKLSTKVSGSLVKDRVMVLSIITTDVSSKEPFLTI